jgi:hypothetical protein
MKDIDKLEVVKKRGKPWCAVLGFLFLLYVTSTSIKDKFIFGNAAQGKRKSYFFFSRKSQIRKS